MQEITAWLKTCQPYDIGASLYKKFGQSDFLKSLFANGATPFNQTKLVAELTKLAPAIPANPVISDNSDSGIKTEKTEIPVIQIIPDAPMVTGNSADLANQERYLSIKENQRNLYRQLERNMVLLDFEKKESILHLTAKQILALKDKIADNYKLLDYFDEKGFFPDKKVKPVTKTNEMQLLYQSLSKAKRRLNSGKCRDIEKTKQLIAQHEIRLSMLKGKACDE